MASTNNSDEAVSGADTLDPNGLDPVPRSRFRAVGRAGLAGAVGAAAFGAAALGLSAGFAGATDTDPLPAGCAATGSTVTCSYAYTGEEQTFTVPQGVTGVEVAATGGRGGAGASGAAPGGVGAVIRGHLEVTPGQQLFLMVGGNGVTATGDIASAPGGFNGGGTGGGGFGGAGGGGGGASDVRTQPAAATGSLASRVLVAAGGGGAGAGNPTAGAGGAAGTAGMDSGERGSPDIFPAGGGGPGTTTLSLIHI